MRALELGTGADISTAWLLEGLDAKERLQTVDSDEALVAIAREVLGTTDCFRTAARLLGADEDRSS